MARLARRVQDFGATSFRSLESKSDEECARIVAQLTSAQGEAQKSLHRELQIKELAELSQRIQKIDAQELKEARE